MNSGSLELNITEMERTIDGKKWFRTLPIEDLTLGEKKKFKLKEKEILLINKGDIYAIENLCPHMDLPLDIGQITEKNTILCPYHKRSFALSRAS